MTVIKGFACCAGTGTTAVA